MNNSRTATQLLVRLPEDVKEWLQRQAQLNMSSRGAEVVRSVRFRMEAERRAEAAN